MKNYISLFLFSIFFVFSTLSNAQDIITDTWMSDDYISLGEEVDIEFDVSYLTDCDSYTIEVEIDYSFEEIIITVDYDYDEDCDEDTDYESEEVTVMPLLEGTYDVTIICDVAFELFLDEEVDLGELEVGKPEKYDCDDYSIPDIHESCPSYGGDVCACDGHNYDNECEAFFEEEHGIYYHFDCGDFVEENSVPFKCDKFYLDIDNTFINYDCSNNEFEGDELYLEYYHSNDGEPLIINFVPSDKDVKLFLVDIYFGDLECIAESDDTILTVDNLSSGTYYIIADCDCWGSESVEICNITSSNDLLKDNEISIFPNPTHSEFSIKSKHYIKNITIQDLLGTIVYKNQTDQREIKLDNNFIPGFYYIEIETNIGTVNTKIVIE